MKRHLGLAYVWTGAANGLARQVWATWLLYAILAVLIDLSDAVAEELYLPFDRISVDMVFRGCPSSAAPLRAARPPTP